MTKADRVEIQRLDSILKKWRAKYSSPTPLPKEAWAGAARLAAKVGVGIVSRELGLDYGKLKRLTATEEPAGSKSEAGLLPAFVEFLPQSATESAPESTQFVADVSCAIEVEAANGGLIRARLEGVSACEMGALFREFVR